MQAELYEPVEDFVGEFGMGNLELLSNIMKFSNHNNDGSVIEITREERKEAGVVPTVLNFMDEYGNRDQYRFMSKEAVEDVMRIGKFKGATWDVTVITIG